MRVWHAQLGAEQLPDVDEIVGSDARGAKRRLYGTDELRGNRAALPALLKRFGLYPWRVQVIAEGKADLAMLKELLDVRFGYTFAELGIHAFSLDGADIPTNAELILGAVRVYSNYPAAVRQRRARATDGRRARARRARRGRVGRAACDRSSAGASRGRGFSVSQRA